MTALSCYMSQSSNVADEKDCFVNSLSMFRIIKAAKLLKHRP